MTKPQTWTTKEGNVVLIREMTDSHLMNTIRFLERKAPEIHARDLSAAYTSSLHILGEQAGYVIDNIVDQLEDTPPEDYLESNETYQQLRREALRRHLIKKDDI